jgi:hypothetical protein
MVHANSSLLVALLVCVGAQTAQTQPARVWEPLANEAELTEFEGTTPSSDLGAVSLTLPLYNIADMVYYFKMQFGTPPQTVRVVFDTAASDVAITAVKGGAHKFFNHSKSTSYKPDGRFVRLRDGWEGGLAFDRLGLSDDVAASGQPFVEITNVSAYGPYYPVVPFDGWFGIGRNETQSVGGFPTFVRALDKLRVLTQACISLSMPRGKNGHVVFGSQLAETHGRRSTAAHTDPHAGLWGFNVVDIKVGDKPIDVPVTAAVNSRHGYAALDSASPAIIGPAAAVNQIAKLVNATSLTHGMFSVPCDASIPDISFCTNASPPEAYTLTKDELVGRRISATDCQLLIGSGDPKPIADWELGIPLFHRYSFGFCWSKPPGQMGQATPFLTKALLI